MRTFLNKHKFLRVVKFNSDKTSEITYYKREKLPKTIIINPDHVFNHNGYSTIVITDKSAESINPLNFNSKYDIEMFKSAIDNKLIHDTFNTLKTNKFDLNQIIMFGLIFINIIMLYFILKQNGVF